MFYTCLRLHGMASVPLNCHLLSVKLINVTYGVRRTDIFHHRIFLVGAKLQHNLIYVRSEHCHKSVATFCACVWSSARLQL